MKRKYIITAAGILLTVSTLAVVPDDDSNTDTASNPFEISKNDYDKYGEKLNTKFKGTEDLALLKEVVSWLGTPYKYGSNNKGKGTDCSGFVQTVFKNVYNLKLQRTSSSMVLDVNKVERDELECGDLLFFANSNGSIYHVAIYLSDDVFVHSATSKNIGVKTDNLTQKYYATNFYSAGRIKSLDKRGIVADNSTTNNVVNGVDKNKSNDKKDVADLYSEYSKTFGVKFKGNEDLTILKEINSWLGTPYQSGKSERGVATDGPGLICGVFENASKILLSRTPDKLKKNLTKSSKRKLKFADIVFYKKGNNYPIIGIYLGDGKIAYASVSKGVMVIDMATVSFNLDFIGSISALNY